MAEIPKDFSRLKDSKLRHGQKAGFGFDKTKMEDESLPDHFDNGVWAGGVDDGDGGRFGICFRHFGQRAWNRRYESISAVSTPANIS